MPNLSKLIAAEKADPQIGESAKAVDEVNIVDFLIKNAPYLDPEKLGIFLSEEDNKSLLQQYVAARYEFADQEFTQAFRNFNDGDFKQPGEAQKIDRLMQAFAYEYHEKNPTVFKDAKAAYALAFSMMMLNTDLHNPNIKKANKMTEEQFIRNNQGMNSGEDFPVDVLKKIFNNIKNNELKKTQPKLEDKPKKKSRYLTKLFRSRKNSKEKNDNKTSVIKSRNASKAIKRYQQELQTGNIIEFDKKTEKKVIAYLKKHPHKGIDYTSLLKMPPNQFEAMSDQQKKQIWPHIRKYAAPIKFEIEGALHFVKDEKTKITFDPGHDWGGHGAHYGNVGDIHGAIPKHLQEIVFILVNAKKCGFEKIEISGEVQDILLEHVWNNTKNNFSNALGSNPEINALRTNGKTDIIATKNFIEKLQAEGIHINFKEKKPPAKAQPEPASHESKRAQSITINYSSSQSRQNKIEQKEDIKNDNIDRSSSKRLKH